MCLWQFYFMQNIKEDNMIEPYDEMKSDFILISNEVEAKYCIFKYGNDIAKKHLPKELHFDIIRTIKAYHTDNTIKEYIDNGYN